MERGHYSEVHSFLRSNTPRANWTAEQRQFYKRTYSVDKKGNLCDKRTGLQVSQLEDQIPRPNVSKDSASVGISYAASKYGKTNLSPMEQYRSANNRSPMEANRSPSRSRSPSYNLFSSYSSDRNGASAHEREKETKPLVYQPMMKSRALLESELLETQREKDRLYVYQPRGLSRSRLSSEDRDMPSSSSDSQRLKEDILESDRMSRMQSEERDDRGERESSVCSVSFSVSSATSAQNVKYNSAEEEVDALRYLVRQQKRQIADQESKMRQLQSNMQMTLESKSAAEEAAKNRRNEAELEIKQLKEAIRNAKDTALADCKRLLAHTKEKLLAAEADLDVETKRHSDAFRKSQNELSQTRGDLATALEESDQRRVQMEKETEKLRKAEADIKSQSEQITRLEAFVAQLKLKLSVNIQTVVEQQAKLTASEAKLAAQKTFVQELQAKIGAKDSAIQTMRKKLFDAMQMLPDLDTPRKLKTIFENEMESVLPDIVDITLKNGTYYSDNERRSRAKVEAALRLCEEIEELEASNEQLLQEYEEAVSENTEKISAVALTTISNASSSSICNPDLGESTTKDADVDLPVRSSAEEFKEQSECYETESRMEAKCSLPEEETLDKSELPTSDLNVQQTCESPKRVTFPDSHEKLTPEKQEDQCDNANKTDSSSDSSPPMQAKKVCKSTEAVTPLESGSQQKQENENKLNEDKKEKVASAKKVSKSAVPQMQKAKNFTSKQDTGRHASTIKSEPTCAAENSSKEEAKKSCDSVAVVDECASEVANAVADAIADAHAGAKAVIEQLENESPPQVAAKDEQLLNSMKKLESLRQRLNQKKAANKLAESTPKESE